MRKLEGDLALVGLANFLQAVAHQNARGTLTIARGEVRKRLYLDGQTMQMINVSVRRATNLGQILLRMGKILPDVLQQILPLVKDEGKKLGEVLVARGWLAPDDLDQALREQAAEEIYDLFTWEEAHLNFSEEAPAEPDRMPPLPITAMILEAARRIDEMREIRRLIPTDGLIPVRTPLDLPQDDPGLDPDAVRHLATVIDGLRPVSEIQSASLYPPFVVLRTLAALAARGLVKLGSGDQAPQSAAPVRSFPQKRYVMVLSDLPTYRDAIAAEINRAGLSATSHDAGQDWSSLLEGLQPDAIVLDLGSGEGSLIRCQRLHSATEAPIVILIANPSKRAVMRAVESGACEVLAKPVAMDGLLSRLQKIFPPPAAAE